MKSFYATKGTIHQKSCVEALEQNGIVERMYQHILNFARALLSQAKLSLIFSGGSINTVVHLINGLTNNFIKWNSFLSLV